MSNKGLNLIIVLFGVCSNLYGLYGVGFGKPIPMYGGYYQFLTIVGVLVSTATFIMRIIQLLTGHFTLIYESLSAITVPVEGLISLIYWPLVLYDRKMLIPEGTVFDLPLSLDIVLHLIPTIVSWIDLMKFNASFKRSPVHVISIYAFTMGYYFWINVCFEINGIWAYPFLAMFKNDNQRGAFFILAAWIGSLLYKLVLKGHASIHNQQEKVKTA